MDYRIEVLDEYPGSNPSGVYFEEFEKESDEAAIEEFNQRAEKLKQHETPTGKWRAHGLVRIDQHEITTDILVRLTAG